MKARILLVLLCIPSAGILLYMVYGGMAMSKSGLLIFLPSLLLFSILWLFAYLKKNETNRLLVVGFWAGLWATICYDLVRVPVLFLGQRVFAPIRMYGLWLTDSGAADAFSDIIGWVYHYSNGIFFGIAYVLVMKKRPTFWAVLYALALETLFVFSPFGDLLEIKAKPFALAVAYIGHIAYGYPLGYIARHVDQSFNTIFFFRKPLFIGSMAVLLVGCFYLYNSSQERMKWAGAIMLDEYGMHPSLVRVTVGQSVFVYNRTRKEQNLVFLGSDTRKKSFIDEPLTFTIDDPGIIHVYNEDNKRTNGVIVVSEPVFH